MAAPLLMALVPRGRLRDLVATVAVATVVVGGAALLPGSAPPPSSPGTTDVWVSTVGNDTTCARGNQGLPCLTLSRAYTIAQSGDDVEVASGTYSGVQFTGTKTVTFNVASGGTAHISGTLSNSKSMIFQNASNMTLNGPFVLDGVTSDGALWLKCSNDIEINDMSGINFWIAEGNSRVTLDGGDWGPVYGVPTFLSDSDPAIGHGAGTYTCSEQGDGISRSIVLDHLHFFDNNYFSSSSWAGHPDCLQIFGAVDGFTLRNSILERCGADFMFMATDYGVMWNLLIENNIFRAVRPESSWNMQIGYKADPAFNCSVTFRYNTVDTSVGGGEHAPRINCGSRSPGSHQVYGNIFTQGPGFGGDDCTSWGPTWEYNVFENARCPSSATQGTVTFVDRPTSDTDEVYDYTPASGSIAENAGKPGSYPATDFNGNPRNNPPEAGAFER